MRVVVIGLLAGALFLARSSFSSEGGDVLVLPLLIMVGMVLQHFTVQAEQDTSHCGYMNPAMYLGFIPLAFPVNPALPWHLRLAQGALVLAASCLAKAPGNGLDHTFTYTGLNLLRLLTSGGAYLAVVNLAPPAMRSGAVFAAMIVYYIFDLTIISAAVNAAEEADNQAAWRNVLTRAGRLLPAQPLLGLLAVGFASLILTDLQSPRIAISIAAVLSAMVALSLNSVVFSAMEELLMHDQEQLEVELRKAQHNYKMQKEAHEALQADLDRKSSELDMIYDMARSLGASTNLNETMSIVQSMIRRLRIPYQSCVIYLHKPGAAPNQALTPALADTPYREVLEMSPLLQLQEPLITQVLHDQRPQMILEMTASSEQRIFKDERSVICVPLVVSKENVGVIYLGSVNARTHKDEHLEKLKMLAAYAAPSIKTALLFENKDQDLRAERQIREAVEAKNRQLAGLQKLGQAIGATLKIENTLKVVADSLQQMLPQAQSFILFATSPEDQHSLKAEFANSPYADYIRNLPVRNDEGLLGNATKLSTTLLVQDTQVYDLQNIINNERSVIVAPLTAESDVMGCLYVGAQKENTFTEEHRSLVETVSYQAAIAIKNARLYEQTTQMALTDGLTGLYTHRLFQTRLSEEIEWSDRSGKPICLVMVDTDKFKQYNDTLGHPAGDALLKDIAALLKDKVRSSDVVCRYGGDEFALILKDAAKDQACVLCERIRETFQLRFAAAAVHVTASIGVACYPTDAKDKKDLAQAADAALYVSKKTGRNRVTPSPTLEERLKQPQEEIQPLPR